MPHRSCRGGGGGYFLVRVYGKRGGYCEGVGGQREMWRCSRREGAVVEVWGQREGYCWWCGGRGGYIVEVWGGRGDVADVYRPCSSP